MSYILHVKIEGFVSCLLVIQPAYKKQFEELIKSHPLREGPV
jgi:hypothetical protein